MYTLGVSEKDVRRTEDNLFMLEIMIEMTTERKECLFVAFYRYEEKKIMIL